MGHRDARAGTLTSARVPGPLRSRLANPGPRSVRVTVRDGYGSRPRTLAVGAGQTVTERWVLARSRGWYDLLVTVAGDPHFQRRYAGHVETGEDTVTDPLMGGLV